MHPVGPGSANAFQSRVLGVDSPQDAQQHFVENSIPAPESWDVHRRYIPPMTADDTLSASSHSRTSSITSSIDEQMGRRQYPPTPPYSVGSPASQAEDIADDAPPFGAPFGSAESPKEATVRTHRRHPRGSLSDILGPGVDCGQRQTSPSGQAFDRRNHFSETQREASMRQQPSPTHRICLQRSATCIPARLPS